MVARGASFRLERGKGIGPLPSSADERVVPRGVAPFGWRPTSMHRRRGDDPSRDGSTSNPRRSMDGGSVDELLNATIERPTLDQLEVEVGRALEDRVHPALTGDHREERHVNAVD